MKFIAKEMREGERIPLLNNVASMMSRSYLGMIGTKVGKEDIAFYRMEKNQLIRTNGINGSSCFLIVVLEITPEEIRLAKKTFNELMAMLKPGGKLHIIITSAGHKKLNFGSVVKCFFLKRELSKLTAGKIEAYGVFPDAFSPTLVIPLKKNICQFVYGKLFKHYDGQVIHYIKTFLVRLLGPWIWRDDIVLIVRNG